MHIFLQTLVMESRLTFSRAMGSLQKLRNVASERGLGKPLFFDRRLSTSAERPRRVQGLGEGGNGNGRIGSDHVWAKRIVSSLLIGSTAVVSYSIADDVVLFHTCSREAMRRLDQNKQLKEAMGGAAALGPWYNVSLGVSRGGFCVSSSFPISGPEGTALVRLRACRTEGSRSTLVYNLVERGEWHMLSLQASLTSSAKGAVLTPLIIDILGQNLEPSLPHASNVSVKASSEAMDCSCRSGQAASAN